MGNKTNHASECIIHLLVLTLNVEPSDSLAWNTDLEAQKSWTLLYKRLRNYTYYGYFIPISARGPECVSGTFRFCIDLKTNVKATPTDHHPGDLQFKMVKRSILNLIINPAKLKHHTSYHAIQSNIKKTCQNTGLKTSIQKKAKLLKHSPNEVLQPSISRTVFIRLHKATFWHQYALQASCGYSEVWT